MRSSSIWAGALLCISLAAAAVCAVGFGREQAVYREAAQCYSLEQPPRTLQAEASGSSAHLCKARFAQAGTRFPELVGWLLCEGTSLDYPIVQADDNDFYLRHLADGTPNTLGAIFLDYTAPADFSAPVSVIYGHTTKDGQMFSSLANYHEQAYYDAHPSILLCTKQTDYSIDLLAAYLVDGNSSYPQSFADDAAYHAFVQQAREHSFFTSPIEVTPEDRLVLLSTCDDAFQNARLAVLGRIS